MMQEIRHSLDDWLEPNQALDLDDLHRHHPKGFLRSAEEWFIVYSLSGHLLSVSRFALAHSIECYLKAAYISLAGDEQKAIGFGHDLAGLWQACKDCDPAFMPDYEIRPSVLASDPSSWEQPVSNRLSKADFTHFSDNLELYMIISGMWNIDFKYWGTAPKIKRSKENRPKDKEKPVPPGTSHPNVYWIAFLKQMRAHAKYPFHNLAANPPDAIVEHLARGSGPLNLANEYLDLLYN